MTMKSHLLNKILSRLGLPVLGLSSLLLLSGCLPFQGDDAQPYSPDKDDPDTAALFQIGDDVIVSVTGVPDESTPHEEPIKEDGTISMPHIGKVMAKGKTAGQLQDAIHDLYVPHLYVECAVSVKPGDRVYFVQGEVKLPGRQIYQEGMTVARAITTAGDFSDYANKRNVLLIRHSGKRFKVNCREVMKHPELDPKVYPGDQIVVRRSDL